MAKAVHDDVLDAALNVIKTNSTYICFCNAQPTTRAEAYATYMLALQAVVTGDFTLSNGDVSGRKFRMTAKSAISVTNSGTCTHIAFVDGTRLLAVTTCTSQPLVAAATFDCPAFDFELADPT
jgi:hypothetical protein